MIRPARALALLLGSAVAAAQPAAAPVCADDVETCPDGAVLSRDPALGCEFPPCECNDAKDMGGNTVRVTYGGADAVCDGPSCRRLRGDASASLAAAGLRGWDLIFTLGNDRRVKVVSSASHERLTIRLEGGDAAPFTDAERDFFSRLADAIASESGPGKMSDRRSLDAQAAGASRALSAWPRGLPVDYELDADAERGRQRDYATDSGTHAPPPGSLYTSLCAHLGGRFYGDPPGAGAVLGAGPPDCFGRCGDGCGDVGVAAAQFTVDCADHDLCTMTPGAACHDEFRNAVDDWVLSGNCDAVVGVEIESIDKCGVVTPSPTMTMTGQDPTFAPPTDSPTMTMTGQDPTYAPPTDSPTMTMTGQDPTYAPPTDSPTTAAVTTEDLTSAPSTDSPTNIPTEAPTPNLSPAPSLVPSALPSGRPSTTPSSAPSLMPSNPPSGMPSPVPSPAPSPDPSPSPSDACATVCLEEESPCPCSAEIPTTMCGEPVPVGVLCIGDGTCGTNANLNNCGAGLSVYRRVPCPCDALTANVELSGVDGGTGTAELGTCGDADGSSVGDVGGGQSHENRQPHLAISYIISLQGVFPSRNRALGADDEGGRERRLSTDPLLGEIFMFGGNFAPRGFAFCDGQLLPINQNQALFSLLGTTYGGDGRTTFALPDLRGRVAVHEGDGPGLSPYSLGQRGGQETVTLTQAQMPSHAHAIRQHTHPLEGIISATLCDKPDLQAGETIELANVTGSTGLEEYGIAQGDSSTILSAGGNQAHENTQPYLAVNYIIALVGTFPPRSRALAAEEDDTRRRRLSGSDTMIGEIFMFGGNFAPSGFAFCDGQLLPIAQNSALFSILGTIYGGDGRTTFGLPDLRGRVPIHAGNGAGLPTYRLGQRGGQETVTLNQSQMPSHGHPVDRHTHDLDGKSYITGTLNDEGGVQGGMPEPLNGLVGDTIVLSNITGEKTDNEVYQGFPPDQSAISNTGGGQLHENTQPYLAVNYIIALQGTFPSRSRALADDEQKRRRLTSDPLIGEIFIFAGNFAPRDFALCDGQLLPIAQNTALFSILGTIYGGDGRTTFGLPDLRGRAPLHHGQGPGLSRYNLGASGGADQVVLDELEMPSHNHDIKHHTHEPDGTMTASVSGVVLL